jgi:gliding motility-associated-like protein
MVVPTQNNNGFCSLLKYFFVYLLLLLNATLGQGQNLVPNPSFENLKTAPNCGLSVSKDVFENTIFDWFMPTSGSPDIYSTTLPNTCAASQPNSSVIFTQFPSGHQLPRTGNNMAGLAPYISQWYREYIAVKLTQPLEVGKAYCCKMHVSLAEGSEFEQNNLAMYFSDDYQYQEAATVLNFRPQVVNMVSISDTDNWIELSGGFVASNAAQYLTIGNFDANAAVGQTYLGPGTAQFAYYYFDDISVEPIIPPPLIVTGNNKVCPGSPLQLEASGWNDIRWYNKHNQLVSNNATLIINSAKQTSYIAKGYCCGVEFSHTVTVQTHPIPKPNLGKNKFICRGGTLLLDAQPIYSTYEWQDGSTTQTFLAQHDGKYSVKVSNVEGCYNSDTVRLFYYPHPSVNLGNDIETCTGIGTINTNANNPFITYKWQDGSQQNYFNYTHEGNYWVTASNPCAVEVSDTVRITKIDLFIPNLITPNNDEHNDTFVIKGLKNSSGNLEIYNEMGASVYRNNQYNNSWSGETLSEGTYYYLFNYPSCGDIKGWVHVLK